MPRFPYINSPFPYYTGRRTVNYNGFQNNRPTQFENTKQRFEPQNTPSVPDSIHNIDSNKCRPDLVQNSVSNECRFEGQKNKSNNNNNDYLFDLFGLKIYTDDVLLVSLIYFLYSEGVKDEGLFIVLILLLLS